MRIGTLNLCQESSHPNKNEEIAKLLDGRVDVLLTQEVDSPLSSLFPYSSGCSPFFSSISSEGERVCYSNFIFSKRKLHYSSFPFPYVIDNGHRIYLLNIHLNDEPYQPYQFFDIPYGEYPSSKNKEELLSFSREARGKAAQKILLSLPKKSRVVVGGDFNEPPYLNTHSLFSKSGGKLIHPPSPTFVDEENNYEEAIDLFYLFNFEKNKRIRKKVYPTTFSDHSLFVIEV